MCDSRADPMIASPMAEERLRLWEIPANMHCTIVGTCLSYAELVKTGRKAGIVPEKNASDYEVHAWFVQRSSEPGRLARLLHKRLDRNHRTAIDACLPAWSEADLEAFWSRSLARADIPGPYWALMTHPSTTEALRAQAFGDVHMLSHRMGSANRGVLRRLRAAEAECEKLSGQLADARQRIVDQVAEQRRTAERHARDREILEDRLRAGGSVEAALAAAEARLHEFERGDVHRALRSETETLAADLKDARRARDARSRKCEALERELSHLREAYGGMSAECAALETMVRADIGSVADQAVAGTPAIDLCGRRIAYVGGRAGSVGHFRALIEKSNGRFSHHDGGVEDSIARLDRVLNQADVVLCPVDCVSHSACLKAKKFCKRAAKTFVPLRTASLSSLVTGLHQAVG